MLCENSQAGLAAGAYLSKLGFPVYYGVFFVAKMVGRRCSLLMCVFMFCFSFCCALGGGGGWGRGGAGL